MGNTERPTLKSSQLFYLNNFCLNSLFWFWGITKQRLTRIIDHHWKFFVLGSQNVALGLRSWGDILQTSGKKLSIMTSTPVTICIVMPTIIVTKRTDAISLSLCLFSLQAVEHNKIPEIVLELYAALQHSGFNPLGWILFWFRILVKNYIASCGQIHIKASAMTNIKHKFSSAFW